MRNLSLQGERWWNVPGEWTGQIVDICSFDNGSRVVLTSDGVVNRIRDDGNLEWTTNVNQVCTEADATNSWFSLTLVDTALVALNHHKGAIVTLHSRSGDAELVGEFEDGIHAGAWSPDKEILLLMTLAEADDSGAPFKSVLLSMNAQFEVLEEVHIDDHVYDVNNPLADQEEYNVSLCWRPDSTLVAVSSVDAADKMRKVRIYKREALEFHAIGRTEDGSGKLAPNLQSTPIAWAGIECSQILASIQRKGTKLQQVAFFEPNGLRHREFSLREDLSTTVVLNLSWNASSDLLAISLQGTAFSKVQLWHRSNYHWYLKKEFRYEDRRAVNARFHPILPYMLVVTFESERSFVEYDLRWDPAIVDCSSPSCTAYVVDGHRLNATPLGVALLPPPMYASVMELGQAVSQMITSRTASTFPFLGAAVLSDGSVSIIGQSSEANTKTGLPSFEPPSLLVITPPNAELQGFRHFCIVEEGVNFFTLIAATAKRNGCQGESIVEMLVTYDDDGGAATIEIRRKFPVDAPVLTIVAWSDTSDGALVELNDGRLFEYSLCGDEAEPRFIPLLAEALLEPCPWIAGLRVGGKDCDGTHGDRSYLVVGMSSKGRLYCHDLLLADSVSSFFLSTGHGFLSYASVGSQCQLRFLALHELHNFDSLLGSDDNRLHHGFEPRNVERGARLVAITSDRPTAVLQMPRGNLEGVYPRALVLKYAVERIRNKDFRAAFALMRTQKVDLNLIVDLDPISFLNGGAVELIRQISNIDYLNLLISTLGNYDSTRGRFVIPDWLRFHEDEDEHFDFTTKVTTSCRCLRFIMMESEQSGATQGGHYLLPILSTFAKEEPPKLDEALGLIRDMALRNSHLSKKPPLFSDAAQSAIQYLAFLAEYELLFNTALSMYDYEMARAVARSSQMDPKVYIPLLKRLRELPPHYAKYEVDMKLKRYDWALRNLYQSGVEVENLERAIEGDVADVPTVGNSFEHCMTIIGNHHLYCLGLELFGATEHRKHILVCLGDYLMKQKNPSGALSIYMSSEPVDIERSMAAAKICRDWRTYFQLLSIQYPDKTDSVSSRQAMIAHELSDELASESNGHLNRRELLSDAAVISYQYENDVIRATDFLIQGELWSEAQRISLLAGRVDLVQKCVDAAVSSAESFVLDLDERRHSFVTNLSRYSEVLKIRREAMASADAGGPGEQEADDAGSLFSVASNATNISMTSYASTSSASSLSSVISVKSTTSFSVVRGDDMNRHKSKYNEGGGKRRDRGKKKKKSGSKPRPGSEQELEGVVQTLRSCCIDEKYREAIEETITFLLRQRKLTAAQELYNEYTKLITSVKEAQMVRLEVATKEKVQRDKQRRQEGHPYAAMEIAHPLESEVDSIRCPEASESLQQLFAFLPAVH